jgi:uncharacterized phage infection (PIP) family protein YhgE
MLPRTTTRGPLDKRGVDMDTSETTHTPEESGLLRRGLFPRREQAQADTMTETETRLDETVRRAVDDRVEAGMRQIEDQTTGLLREVATEVWRTSAKDVRPEQERIMSILARDQAIRGLITTSDERFQAIAVRTARLEDNLSDLAESERRTREAMEAAAISIREISQSPTLHGVEMVRTQLEQVERHLAETFTHFDERDREIAEQLQQQVREHGDLIANETARIVESMQSYVQGGAEAIGRLAQRIEEHAKLFVLQDHNITEHEQLQAAIERMIDARMRGMAELVRSDSMALQKLVQERMAAPSFVVGEDGQVAFDEASLTRTIDQRMGALAQVVEERMDLLERTIAEQVLALSNATAASMERNLERMATAAGAVDGLDEMVAEGQQAFEERMLNHIDERMAQIARLVRSDNQALAVKVEALNVADTVQTETLDAELLRSVLRSIKELQAGMASDMLGTIDVRFQQVADQLHREGQGQAESMLKVAEVLGQKIDRLSIRVDEGVGNDLQIVVDRMSDAIRAMSGVRRDIA